MYITCFRTAESKVEVSLTGIDVIMPQDINIQKMVDCMKEVHESNIFSKQIDFQSPHITDTQIVN